MSNSEISTDLVTNYCRAVYQVGIGVDAFILRIDQYSKPMFELLVLKNVSNAAIISAYNPLSQVQSHKKNLNAHAALLKILKTDAASFIEGKNIDPSGIWADEKSICIFGVSIETARALGRQFSQNAIVWVDNNAVPRLVLLR
ncbi:MAG TPA: DUF3293 domain-containing protein [Nitrosomonas sp.]|uniref:DUF3293 domain-containing protein n=1 Tax=Nitrosomonas sp. TaxID=42353 RepID=UPI0025F5EBAB|nr:DUF3293 domain-containing protein [Nitrosomonas sp.]HNP26565.1 DUF3293 domain-containing protein [Nitrosomonas sp.]